MKVYRDPADPKKIDRIELSAGEMAEKILGIEVEELESWRKLLPPKKGSQPPVFAFSSLRDPEISLLKKRAALLRTGMSVQAVRNVEKEGLLDAYAGLAEDCPEGVTAHVWRSYGIVVLIQLKTGRMIGASELAARAGLVTTDDQGNEIPDVETAGKHLRLLVALGHLERGVGEWEGQWRHRGLPSSWVRDD